MKNVFLVKGIPVKFCFEEISVKSLRVVMLPTEESVKEVYSTIDLADRVWVEPSRMICQVEGSQELFFDNFKVCVEGSPISIAVYKGQKLIQKLSICSETGYVSFSLDEGHIFGLGHGFTKHFERRGELYDLRTNGQVRGIIENYSATSPTPYVISTNGWALHFHQPWKATIDLQGDTGVFMQSPAAYCDIFVIAVDDPADAAKEYYELTGKPPMPPKYAFGYQQSYRTLVFNGENEVIKTAKYMRENDIPCDVLIYLGTGYCENGWNTHNGNFEWNPVAFPEPKKTMQELHDMNYKISLHVTRCYTGLHGTVYDEDVSLLEYDHAKNYWKKHEELYETSRNEVWWPDDGDEVDMEQRLTRHKMYYEGSLKLNPNVRPLQMQRNAFPGMTKYGGIIWSGDVLSEWETLKNQVPIGLNVALSSSPYWGTDIGGFGCTKEYDGELFTRWFEYSTFTPFFRAHGRMSYLHNPWGWKRKSIYDMPNEVNILPRSRESLPEENILPDERIEPICKKFIHARYELLPYIYNLSHEAYDSGMPIMRPLWFKYPDDSKAAAIGSAFLLGDSLLVAPVTAKGAEEWEVYLPEGTWYCYWNGECYEGGKTVICKTPLDTIPVFVPAGGIIAKAPVVQYVDTSPKDTFDDITLVIYKGACGEYSLYEDDGISMEYQKDVCTRTYVKWNDEKGEISICGTSSMFSGKERELKVCLMPQNEKRIVTVKYEG